jgi:hypothetical protein
MNWLRQQYKDIKGHLKWEIIKFVAVLLVSGGGLTVLAHWFQAAFHANITGWLALAAPIFSILAVLYLLVIFTPRTKRNAAVESFPAEYELPSGPRSVDLRGEILEIYFMSAPYMMSVTVAPMHILLKVRVVNHGPDQATITHCGLDIDVGEFHRSAEVAEIPNSWRIRRRIPETFWVGVADTPVTPQLRTPETYPKGIPHVGWLVFTLYDERVEFPNATFTLNLRDSLGGDHYIRREPEAYKKAGEIVTVSEKPTLEGKSDARP